MAHSAIIDQQDLDGAKREVDHALRVLKDTQKKKIWIVPMELQFQALKLELRFLGTFLKYTANRWTKYGSVPNFSKRLRNVTEKANVWIIELSRAPTASAKYDHLPARILDKIKLVKPKVREAYMDVSKSSRSRSPPMGSKIIVEFVDSLQKDLKDLLMSSQGHEIVSVIRKELESLESKLQFLKALLNFSAKRCKDREKLERLSVHTLAMIDQAAYLSYSCLVDHMDEDMARTLTLHLIDLVQNIQPLQPEVRRIYLGVLKASKSSRSTDGSAVDFIDSLLENIVEVLRCETSLIMPVKNQTEVLHQELHLLRYFLEDPPNNFAEAEKLNHVVTDIEVTLVEAACAVYSFYDTAKSEDRAKKIYLGLSNLLGKIKLIKAQVRDIYLKVPKLLQSNFSRTDGLGFLDFLQGNLKDLLKYRGDSIALLKHDVEILQGELEILRLLLGKIAKQRNENEKLKSLWARSIDAAYEAEYSIESFLVKDGPRWHRALWLSDVIEEIKLVRAEVKEMQIAEEMKTDDLEEHNVAMFSSRLSSQPNLTRFDEEMVGFEDEEEKILEQLVVGTEQLRIVSIVGMPGLGKTQLAKKVYNHSTVKEYFYVRAWCCVSQVYQRKQLLINILQQVKERENHLLELTDEDLELTDEDLAGKLHRSLKGQKYLIVIDDIWDSGAWDALKRSFPNDNLGSRIVFTSRFYDLALKVKPNSKVHPLRPFSDDESWQLLTKKLFPRESCPLKFLEVGKKIAKSCKGLPLVVVVVAGILSKTAKKEDRWRDFADSLSSYLIGDQGSQYMDILELSYKGLPDYLKPCFLYFGAFPEDKEISCRKLMMLWIAEGFVQKANLKSLESIAQDYLMDLSDRSLIIVTKRRTLGGIKACCVHDLIRDFCLAKAKEENFSTSTTNDGHIIWSRSLGPHARSLVFFVPGRIPYAISQICRSKLLRVLELVCMERVKAFPDGIDSLIHLTYLSLCVDSNSIPSSIAKLWNLKIFLVSVKAPDYEISRVFVPHTIWNMVQLQHLHIDKCVFLPQLLCSEDFSELDNLQTFSTPVLKYGDDMAKAMTRLPNLRKLKCIFLDSWDHSANCNRLPVLDFLGQLESLNVSYQGRVLHPFEFRLPLHIKKLTMSRFYLPWNEISIIGKLPNLEVLKLHSDAFAGEEWNTSDGEFLKLKFLEFCNLDIRIWNMSSDHFPRLEQLGFHSCWRLKEIPSCLGDISTLKLIEESWCTRSLKESIKQFQEEELEMGNEQLKVHVDDKVIRVIRL